MTNQQPTHYKLINELKAIGPYLRENECQTNQFYFDCLSVCIDDTKSPELREFWGWWMSLERNENQFVANYTLGQYDKKGQWQDKTPPESAAAEVTRTLDAFHAKLCQVLNENYDFEVSLHQNSVEITSEE